MLQSNLTNSNPARMPTLMQRCRLNVNNGSSMLLWLEKNLQQSPKKIEEQTRLNGWLITIPPWLNLLRITNQSFQRTGDPYLWQYAIDNDGENKGSSDKVSSPPLQHPPLEGSPPASAEVAMTTAPAKKKAQIEWRWWCFVDWCAWWQWGSETVVSTSLQCPWPQWQDWSNQSIYSKIYGSVVNWDTSFI